MLSSTEAELIALSDTVKKVMFIVKLLQSMRISVKLLVAVRVENVGAIFVAGNVTAISHTKHADFRYK